MPTLDTILHQLFAYGVEFGKKIIIAALIYFIGRYIIRWLNKLFNGILERRKIEPELKTFLNSLVSISLNVLMFIAVIGALGVETTSFAALLASVGVAVGMALSGQMQNFAGGVIILLNKPYKIGDFINTNGMSGTVTEIQIFNTKLLTTDNITILVPNGSISSSVLTNYSEQPLRRIDFSVGVEYGTPAEKVRESLMRIIGDDERILAEPAPFIALGELADSSVNFTVRVWTEKDNYWPVLFDLRETVYKTFNSEGIAFPFPQLTIHPAK